MKKQKLIIFIALFFINVFCSTEHEQTTTDSSTSTIANYNITECACDLLKGQGFFRNLALNNWKLNSTRLKCEVHHYESDQGYLHLEKEEELSFEDGLILNFDRTKPRHIRFFYAPSQLDNENTNLRIKSSLNGKTILSFRCGNAGFVRVNDNQMVDFFNSTVSTKKNIIWTKADLILNWEDKEVKIYLNETFKGTSGFYHPDVIDADTIMLYNLKPGSQSFWRNIQVCEGLCDGFNYGIKIKFINGIILTAFILLFTIF